MLSSRKTHFTTICSGHLFDTTVQNSVSLSALLSRSSYSNEDDISSTDRRQNALASSAQDRMRNASSANVCSASVKLADTVRGKSINCESTRYTSFSITRSASCSFLSGWPSDFCTSWRSYSSSSIFLLHSFRYSFLSAASP